MKNHRYILRAGLTAAFVLCTTVSGLRAQASDAGSAQIVGKGAEALAKADTDFAKLAVAQGPVKAFEAYLTPDCISPSPSVETPLDRKASVARLVKLEANGMTLDWKPLRAEIAASGELGFTYGKWVLTEKASGTTLSHGFYTTVWRKQADGTWKATFDMGNEAPAAKAINRPLPGI